MKENKQQKGILLENFEEKEGETVSQDYVLKLLNVSESQKKHVARLIKSKFPKVTVQKKMSSGKSQNEYLGLSRKIIFMSPSTSEQSLLDMSGINPEIEKLKREIHNINEELDNIGKSLESQFDTETKNECILILFQRYNMLANKRQHCKTH